MMPKDKAKALIDKYEKENYQTTMPGCELINAKQCALICVDEIIKSDPTEPSKEESSWDISNEESLKFWQEVKQEIEKL